MKRFLRLSVFALTLLAFSLLTGSAEAGELENTLNSVLRSTPENHFVKGIIVLSEQADIKGLTRELDALKADLQWRHETIIWVLQDTAQETQGNLIAKLDEYKRQGSVKNYTPFWIANMIAVEAKPAVFYKLAKRSEVSIITYDYKIGLIAPVSVGETTYDLGKSVENGLVVIRAPELWSIGITGAGTIVCNLDTGVDGTHPALSARWRGLVPGVPASAAWYDPVTSTNFPFDSGSHGTHTMGTITGKAGDTIVGVAYDAKWIAAGVIDRVSIDQTLQDAIKAFQWAADPDGNPATTDDIPDVISNSWGLIPITHGVPECDSSLWAVIDNVEAAGSIVVFAAGNEGPSAGSLRTPADRIASPVNVFAVGALNQNGTTIADFSSRGPSDCDDVTVKPEVTAVGVDVRSSVPGGGYSTMSGTSMATPHVAGAIALLRQAHPNATADQVKTALYMSAFDLGASGEDNTFGRGRIDLVEALAYMGPIEGMGLIDGSVTEAGSGDPIPRAAVTIEGTEYQTTTKTDGSFKMLVPGDENYTITVETFGYESDSETVYVEEGETTDVDFSLQPSPRSIIYGTTKDAKGEPLEGVTVSITNVGWRDAISDEGGYYSLSVPVDYTYDLMASKDGYKSDTVKDVYVPPHGGTLPVNFELRQESGCFMTGATSGTSLATKLRTLYKFRDKLLVSDKMGARYTDMYYKHSAEMLKIALSDRKLLSDTLVALDKYMPFIDDVSYAKSIDEVQLTPKAANDISGLLRRYQAKASPNLARDIDEVVSVINSLTLPKAVGKAIKK